MLLSLVCTPTLIPYFPKLSPPTTRCRLRPPYSISITAATTASTADPNSHFLVEYLVDSIGLPKHEAISVSTQVNHLKSSKNAQLFINLFLKYGLNKPQIREIVSSSPKILLYRVDGTLEPKIKFLIEEIGFSPTDLVKLIVNKPTILSKSLDDCIKPTFNFLKEVLGSDEIVVQSTRDSPWLLSSPSSLKRMQLNVEMLRNYGLTDEEISKSIIRNPGGMMRNPDRIQDALSRVDVELGIPLDSGMLLPAIYALSSATNESLQIKFKIFRSFGWTDSDIAKMSRSQPYCLTMTEGRIRKVLNILMKELGYTPEYLASHACLMMYSMEKRVKPRNQVLKILKENKLVSDNLGLFTLVIVPESTFLNRYVLRFKAELPNLYEIYRNSRMQ